MPAELSLPMATVNGFLLVIARVGGALAFVPIPGFRAAPAAPRVVLALALTMALLPAWPPAAGAAGFRPVWLLAEAAFGLSVGLLVGWLSEAFVMAMQVLGLQAGYAYASMIDPTTQADSSTLQIIAQLAASLLFLAFGMEREVFRVFAASLESFPPGGYRIEWTGAASVIGFCGSMLELALRLALPLVALLVLVDVSLALLGRINASLQLLSLAFPAKMLTSMAVLAALAGVLPAMFRRGADELVRAMWGLVAQTP